MIYADNAATTRVSDLALAKMQPFLVEQYGNASSQYGLGSKARRAIEAARQQVASAIACQASEVVFTSGGSEGNNWLWQSLPYLFPQQPIHVITTSIEHASIMQVSRAMAARGLEVTYLPVNSQGLVSVEEVRQALRPHTKLLSIMMANNEVGTIEPLAEIGQLLQGRQILFHSDAVQAVGHLPINVKELHLDFLTASAHKFNALKGCGFLYMGQPLSLPNFIFGGGQERGFRAGTENVPGIVAMGEALQENLAMLNEEMARQAHLVEATVEGLKAEIPDLIVNGCQEHKLPGLVNLTFPGLSGEALMHLLDLKGICVSTSSACNSGQDHLSHVLLALGLSPQLARASLRLSYGRYNNMSQVEAVVAALVGAYRKITDNLNH